MSQTPESVLNGLYDTLVERKSADPGASYAARLYHDGLDAILRKVGEEAAETVIAAKNADRGALVHELADLWFHTLVLMVARDVPLPALIDELNRRRGTSGLAEKAARGKTRE